MSEESIERILIIDDDPTITEFYMDFINHNQKGINIDVAGTYEDALDLLAQGTYDKIIVDGEINHDLTLKPPADLPSHLHPFAGLVLIHEITRGQYKAKYNIEPENIVLMSAAILPNFYLFDPFDKIHYLRKSGDTNPYDLLKALGIKPKEENS